MNDRRFPVIETRHGTLAWNERTQIMAIVNLTPDSFSGDGIDGRIELAVQKARQAEANGAAILDLGAESTRPGHRQITASEELERLLPALKAIRAASSLPISIDTSKAMVARVAIEEGADIINDVRGFMGDPGIAEVAALELMPVILMHDLVPEPGVDLIASILRELSRRIDHAVARGVAYDNIIVDPGFGFGKDWRQNLELLRRLGELQALGRPILVGLSRKRTIGAVLGTPEHDRVEGTAATTVMAIERGADIVRVHDVLANARAAQMTDAVVRNPPITPKAWQAAE
jgi:dihydropteroate synthase